MYLVIKNHLFSQTHPKIFLKSFNSRRNLSKPAFVIPLDSPHHIHCCFSYNLRGAKQASKFIENLLLYSMPGRDRGRWLVYPLKCLVWSPQLKCTHAYLFYIDSAYDACMTPLSKSHRVIFHQNTYFAYPFSIKGGLISESFFSLWLKCPKTDPEHYPRQETILSVVIWQLFRRFEPKGKTFCD